MFKNYLKTAIRDFKRSKFNTFINIFGLSVGIATSIMIFLYAENELSYDSNHEKSDRIYQVYKERHIPTGVQITRDTWYPMAKALQEDYAGIEEATHIWEAERWVQTESKKFKENVSFVRENIFRVFTFPLIQGNPDTAFDELRSAVVSQKFAEKMFGSENPMGKTFTLDFEIDYKITGVFEPIPQNSTYRPEIMIPSQSYPYYDQWKDLWGSSWLDTYVLLKENVPKAGIETQLPAFVDKIFEEEGKRLKLKLTALPDLHNEITGANIYAYILIILACAILIIASINFMNLSTAKSLERAGEIGMRKVLGASRIQLIRQYLSETLILSLMALIIGILLTKIFLPVFNQFYGTELTLNFSQIHVIIFSLLGLGILVGFISGIYPAFVISKYEPSKTLRGTYSQKPAKLSIRNALLTLQFAFSMILIIGTFVMNNQIQYMKNIDLNMDKENILAIPVEISDFKNPEDAQQKIKLFKEELRNFSGAQAVAASSHIPGRWSNAFTFVYPLDRSEDQRLRQRYAVIDEHYFELFGIELVQGRNFSSKFSTDQEEAAVLNETALKDIGWKSLDEGEIKAGKIVGVVKDYKFLSLEQEVPPVIHFFRPGENGFHNFVLVKISAGAVPQTLEFIKKRLNELDPSRQFNPFFLDEAFNDLYQNQEHLIAVSGIFSLIAVIIASLGLLALTTLITTQRTKEIGIRKVLGASVLHIVLMFSRYFSKYVLAAFVLAAPLAYILMEHWLSNYAYRVDLKISSFVLSGLIVLFIAAATVSLNSLKTALQNPANSIRDE